MDNITFTPDTRQQIILAAFNAAGQGATDTEVASQIERIADAMMPGSAAMRTIDEIEHYWGETVTDVNKPFTATILYVDMETTSQRPVLALRSAPNSSNPDGKFELVKLGMARGRNRRRVLAQANEYVRMLGHQVLVTRMNEKTAKGTKASMLRSAISYGPHPEFAALHVTGDDTNETLEAKLAQGAQMVNWSALGDFDQKIAAKLDKLARRNPQRAGAAQPPQEQYVQEQPPQAGAPQYQQGQPPQGGYGAPGRPQAGNGGQRAPWQG